MRAVPYKREAEGREPVTASRAAALALARQIAASKAAQAQKPRSMNDEREPITASRAAARRLAMQIDASKAAGKKAQPSREPLSASRAAALHLAKQIAASKERTASTTGERLAFADARMKAEAALAASQGDDDED